MCFLPGIENLKRAKNLFTERIAPTDRERLISKEIEKHSKTNRLDFCEFRILDILVIFFCGFL
jgi:hypothetical protein